MGWRAGCTASFRTGLASTRPSANRTRTSHRPMLHGRTDVRAGTKPRLALGGGSVQVRSHFAPGGGIGYNTGLIVASTRENPESCFRDQRERANPVRAIARCGSLPGLAGFSGAAVSGTADVFRNV